MQFRRNEGSRVSVDSASNQAGWPRSADFDGLVSEILRALGDSSVSDETVAPRTAASPRLAGVYIISVAARLADMHPQTLRKYDREDLVSPSRTGGMLRLYSDEDVERLRTIGRLVDELGLNLEGVRLVLAMVDRLQDVAGVLERSPEVAGARTARIAADEIRGIVAYVGGRA